MVEAGESPTEAAHRECREELGREIEVGPLLCVHYVSGTQVPFDGIAFTFDGGTTALTPGDLTLPADELASAAFVDPGRYLLPPMARRLRAAIEAARTGTFAYLERT
jgi:8-oxo-dGTP pyrophosphatase MutT (NUDIX family)